MLATEAREARILIQIVADAAGRFQARDKAEAAKIRKALGYFGRTSDGETLFARACEDTGADRMYANTSDPGARGGMERMVGAAFRRLGGWIIQDYRDLSRMDTAPNRGEARAKLAALFPAARIVEVERS
jgi:hypothetical protein